MQIESKMDYREAIKKNIIVAMDRMLLHISWDMEKNLPAILLGWQNLLES